MPVRTLLSSEQRITAVLDSDRHGRHGAPLCARRRRSRDRRARRRASNRLGFAVQLCVLRDPGRVLDPTEVPPEPMLAFVARQIGADPALFGEYAPPGRDATRAFARTPKVPGSPKLRSRRLACVPSDRHGCRLGHGSRRAHRPSDARPSPREQHPSAFGGGVGAHRVGRPCSGTQENLRRACHRGDRRRAGHAGGVADSRSGPAPVALRLAAGLLGVTRAFEHRRAVGSPRIRARARNRPGTRRANPHHPPDTPDRRRRNHDRAAHRRARTRAANCDPRCPGREPRNPADRRDTRDVREIHGDIVQPGAQP